MPLWGNKNQPVSANLTTTHESTEGAPLGTYVYVKGDQIDRKGSANAHAGNTVPGSRARTDFDMFESSIFNEFMPNMAVGVYGVFANSPDLGKNKEYHDFVNDVHARKKHLKRYKELPDGEQLKYRVIDTGCGYSGGPEKRGAPIRLYFPNGHLDTTSVQGDIYFSNVIDPPDPKNGKVTGYTVNQELFVDEPPNCDIDPPENFYIECNKYQILPAGFAINYAQSVFGKGDKLFYYVPSGNTPVAPLKGNTYYYVADVNVQYIAFSETPDGPAITLTDPRINSDDPDAEQHTIQGRQAQIEAYIERANNIGSAHSGWILQKEFRGGRQGRIQTECLVAMSSLQEGVIPPGEPEPIVYDINPDYGSEFGGDTVAITGENFISFDPGNPMKDIGDTYATRVLFGNVFANDASIVVANNTYLTVTSPKANKPETVDVRVQTGYGISRVNPKSKFTYYITEPYIRKVTPNRGGYKGQTNVDIVGFNFGSATQVQFDTTNALSFQVMTNEYIRAVSPPHANGTINIFVTGANGTSDADPSSEFTYYSAIPIISNVEPSYGRLDPTTATINGTGFLQYNAKYVGDTPDLKVYFGNYEANITSVVSDTELIVDPPPVLRPNTVDVIVRNGYGNSIPNANSKFRYYADGPTVSNCSPKMVSALVPTDVTVTGNNLWDAERVRYGDIFFIKDNIRVSPDGKTLVFTTVPDPNTNRYMTITIDTPSGSSPEVYDCGISYINFPFVSDLSIHAADFRATNTVTVTGLNFSNPSFKVDNVYFGKDGVPFPIKYYANSSTIKIANNTSMTFELPNFYKLGAEIFITYNTILTSNNNLVSSNTPGCKMYIDNWTPFINDISPDIGPIKGFTEIYCYGKNYAQSVIANAQLGEGPSGIPCKSVKVVNNTLAIVVAPTVGANDVGKKYYVILNSTTCGSSSLSANSVFTYTNNSGTLASLSLNYPGTGYNMNHPPIHITARLFSNGMIDNRAGVAFSGAGQANAGRIISVSANNDFPVLFRGFDNNPTMEVDPPEKYSFAANQSGFSGWPSSTRAFAIYAPEKLFQVGDKVMYSCQGPGGPIKPFQNYTYYYVCAIDSTWPIGSFQLAATKADALANNFLNIFDQRIASNQATNDISFVQGETANVTYTLVP